MKTIILAVLMALSCHFLYAQTDEDLTMIKIAVLADDKNTVEQTMHLPENEKDIFWELYKQFKDEQEPLLDKQLKRFKAYKEHYDNFTDEDAHKMAVDGFELAKERIALREKYFKLMEEKLSSKTAARFFQVERQIQTLNEVRIMQEFPLIDDRK
ncbi:hypothetical protein V6R21_09615 [Limibacter armeniacum]|uniref:hypothetical protein n=1 Tax=Limibacter armeniacum TaxID=466084 RepID=UPI002FE66278